MANPRHEVFGNTLLTVDEIDQQQVVKAECGHSFQADLFEKAQELGVLNIAAQGEPHGVGIRMGEVRKRLAVLNALAKDEVKPLPCPFDQSAFA